MKRCLRCVIPDTRPDTQFEDGVCSACRSYAARPAIDWGARKQALLDLLERHRGRCIVPSSGGKDSHYQVLTLKELGADPIVVTASTCHLTPIGRANIDNLARYASTIEVTPNRTARAKLNRLGLEMVGDISWPEHVSIFTTPFRMAVALGIKLLFYGENPQNQYGGPHGSDEALQLTQRWRSEFGGFLGLRPLDMVGQGGITSHDMDEYLMPAQQELAGVEAHFLGQYLPWDSHANAEKAAASGMRQALPSVANWWGSENLDNAQTGLHDHAMYRKYGFGRLAAQLAVDCRTGVVTRQNALALVEHRDGLFPDVYADVPVGEVLHRIGMTKPQLAGVLDFFTNWDLFDRDRSRGHWRPVLKGAA